MRKNKIKRIEIKIQKTKQTTCRPFLFFSPPASVLVSPNARACRCCCCVRAHVPQMNSQSALFGRCQCAYASLDIYLSLTCKSYKYYKKTQKFQTANTQQNGQNGLFMLDNELNACSTFIYSGWCIN